MTFIEEKPTRNPFRNEEQFIFIGQSGAGKDYILRRIGGTMATEFLKDGGIDKMFAKEKQEIIERQARRYIETQEMLALEKPFRGIISDFIITEPEESAPHGRVIGHLGDKMILTSPIVTLGEFMVETLNSTYKLRGR